MTHEIDEINKSIRRERLIAAAKIRDEIRNAVRLEMTKSGVTPHDLNVAVKEIADLALKGVEKKVERIANATLARLDMQKMVESMIGDEIRKSLGGSSGFRTEVKARMSAAIEAECNKFVENNIQIRFMGGDW